MDAEQKKRGKRTNNQQMQITVDYLESQKILISGKCHPMHTKEVEEKWDILVLELNSVKNGARKDKKQWKTFLAEWKSKTRKKARMVKESFTTTGGGEYNSNALSEIENKLIRVTGVGNVLGTSELPVELDPDTFVDIQIEPVAGTSCEANPTQPDTPEHTGEAPLSVATPLHLGAKKKRARKHVAKPSQLERSAAMYAKSSEEMANAISLLAISITQLATAFSAIAQAKSQKDE